MINLRKNHYQYNGFDIFFIDGEYRAERHMYRPIFCSDLNRLKQAIDKYVEEKNHFLESYINPKI